MTDDAVLSTIPDAYLDLANRMADAAAKAILRHYRTPVDVIDKADESPVTIADREAEQAMRALIKAEQPDHGIYGEEYGGENDDTEWLWVLDPIDGTRSFISGRPMFGTLIALLYRRKPVLGIIDTPVTGERWTGAVGRATTVNGAPARTRRLPDTGSRHDQHHVTNAVYRRGPRSVLPCLGRRQGHDFWWRLLSICDPGLGLHRRCRRIRVEAL